MRINTNISAMNAHRQLGMNQTNSTRSMERLSSGLRINKAADDAAGLAISEKMRSQIRGLGQASRNAQNGVSLIQTAEGALNEVHSILQRIRELAVQAASDTNVGVDRAEIQKEINQLTTEVNRVGNTTEFNTIKLLNASGVNAAEFATMTSNLKKWWLEEAGKLVSDSYGLVADNVNLKIVIVEDLGGPAALVRGSYTQDPGSDTGISGKGDNLELHIAMKYSRPLDSTDGGLYPNYVSRTIAHEMTHAVMARTMNFGALPSWFKEGTAEFVHGADERLKNSIYLLGNGTDQAARDLGVASVTGLIGDGTESSWGGTSHHYSAGYLAVRYLDAELRTGGNDISDFMAYLSGDASRTLDDALGNFGFTDTAAFIADFKSEFTSEADLGKANVILNFGFDGEGNQLVEDDTGSILGADATGNPAAAKTAEDVLPQAGGTGATENDQPLSDYGFTVTFAENMGSSLVLQIGANYGQTMEVARADMRAMALSISGVGGGEVTSKDGSVTARYTAINAAYGGVTDGMSNQVTEYALDVSTYEYATAAMTIVNDAISSVSSERSKLGAYQNRLEHTISNVGNSRENLTAAESRIRDVDMASEMMEFTKSNILHQAATAMLAQANVAPQGVLQLLG